MSFLCKKEVNAIGYSKTVSGNCRKGNRIYRK
nr:MAG TPA: hypothetical protein [Caudoviricetes sp.]